MPYTVQISLDGANLAARLAEVWEWLDRRHIEPPPFQYRKTAYGDVVLRLDLEVLSDAADFGQTFRGAVLGVKDEARRE